MESGLFEMMGDRLDEACSVFGIWAPDRDVSRLTYFGLHALQHRGQESAGIAVGATTTVMVRKDLGLVTQVFSEGDLHALQGHVGLGHVRYGTAGAKNWESSQPHLSLITDEIVALAHNGTLVNTDELRRQLIDLGIPFNSDSDSEVAAKLIGYFTQETHHIREGIRKTMELMEGAYAMALINANSLYAFRDPMGIRPLVIGKMPEDQGWVVASETCALDIVGAEFYRDVKPGEVVRMNEEGLSCEQAVPALGRHLCSFEHVYFARPDSVMEGDSIYEARVRMGEQLAREAPAEADLVIGVPDSGLPSAVGYARESGIPFAEGIIKNRYVGRTFIQPSQEQRQLGIKLKLNPLRATIEGKHLVVVDDSIVRGNTAKQLVKMLRDAGAASIHLRIVSPEVKWPCFYGIDTDVQSQLISAYSSVEEVREFVDADSLAFMSCEGVRLSIAEGDYCDACLTGNYVIEIPESFSRGRFLEGYAPNNLNRACDAPYASVEDAYHGIRRDGTNGSLPPEGVDR